MLNQKLKLISILLIGLLLALVANTASAAKISNLKDGDAIRSNEGTLVIEVEADQPFTLLIDSVIVKTIEPEVPITKFTLYNVDRGTHLIQVVSVEKVDQLFVHMLRVHK